MRSSPWATGLQARLPHGRGPPANVKLTAHIEVAAINSIRRRMTGQVKVAEASPDRQGASARKAYALAVLRGAPGGTRTPDPQIRSKFLVVALRAIGSTACADMGVFRGFSALSWHRVRAVHPRAA